MKLMNASDSCSSLRHQVSLALDRKGGSKVTLRATSIHAKLFSDYVAKNFKLNTFSQVKPSHVSCFFDDIRDGKSVGTLQNYAASLRSVMRLLGCRIIADSDHISNLELGISGRSRGGTHRAISPTEIQAAVTAAQEIDQGVSLVVELMGTFGLRIREAITSPKSLLAWIATLEKRGDYIDVIYGPKGGRPRRTRIFNKEVALELLKRCASYIQTNGGWLIDRETREQALEYVYFTVRKIGLTGEISPHSLRYAFAHRQFEIYLQSGLTHESALAFLAEDLGHGNSRTTWVRRVYLKGHPKLVAKA